MMPAQRSGSHRIIISAADRSSRRRCLDGAWLHLLVPVSLPLSYVGGHMRYRMLQVRHLLYLLRVHINHQFPASSVGLLPAQLHTSDLSNISSTICCLTEFFESPTNAKITMSNTQPSPPTPTPKQEELIGI